MLIDVGSTVEGTVVKLADYGVIVRLQGGKTGLIHISEIADTFVRDVKDYFKEHDRVRVKVLSINGKGRYELSAKMIEQPVHDPPPEPVAERRKRIERPREPVNLGPETCEIRNDTRRPANFEDLVGQYLKESQERLLDVKRNVEAKRGIKRR